MNMVILGHEKDNVLTCCRPIEKGQQVEVGTVTICALDAVPIYHKIAVKEIKKGDCVMKYGMPIGIASCDIHIGSHVHIHNIESARGRGDKKENENEHKRI